MHCNTLINIALLWIEFHIVHCIVLKCILMYCIGKGCIAVLHWIAMYCIVLQYWEILALLKEICIVMHCKYIKKGCIVLEKVALYCIVLEKVALLKEICRPTARNWFHHLSSNSPRTQHFIITRHNRRHRHHHHHCRQNHRRHHHHHCIFLNPLELLGSHTNSVWLNFLNFQSLTKKAKNL